MYTKMFVFLLIIGFLNSTPIYKDGVLIEGVPEVPRSFAVVIDSFPSQAGYSMGIAFDGLYLWNDAAFSRWFAKMDTLGNIIATFNPTSGNRDMTFDGRYLYATDWSAGQIFKYDTATCTVIASYPPPFAGKPHGMAWTGKYFWLGEEGGRLYLVDTNMTLIRSIPSPNSSSFNPRGLAFDGKDLWVGCQTIGIIFRVDTINGTILEQFTAPSSGLQQGLTWDGRYLWSTGGNNWIYKIDVLVNIQEKQTDMFAAKTGIRFDCLPNPFKQKTFIRLQKTDVKQQPIKLSIYDATGRLIKTFNPSLTFTYPLSFVTWKGDNSEGNPVQAGIYFIHLEVGANKIARKLVHIQ